MKTTYVIWSLRRTCSILPIAARVARGRTQRWRMRGWGRVSRWAPLIGSLCLIYIILLIVAQWYANQDDTAVAKKPSGPPPFTYTFKSKNYPPFEVVDVLTGPGITFEERMHADVEKEELPRLILSWDVGHGPENLGGCPDWNCEFTTDRRFMAQAAVVLMLSGANFKRQSPEQIIAFFSQESPKNMGSPLGDGFFNMSLGYRHDTPAASPYGYTVKLAKPREFDKVVNRTRLAGKNKMAAWFVSHCSTNSHREALVEELQKHLSIDVYGGCKGGLRCDRGAPCENMLDTDYYFYMALENSVCTDYITEKVWNQGYGRDIVPIVLKKSVADGRLPPNSYIAVDDFESVEALATYMNYLVANKDAYLEYFKWRMNYQTVFLNGADHDALERPWGFCQLCRLAWQKPRKHHVIENFYKWWYDSCEPDAYTVNKILIGPQPKAPPPRPALPVQTSRMEPTKRT